MTEPERCGVIAYTLPPAPDRTAGFTAKCRLVPGHRGFHRHSEQPSDPEARCAREVRGPPAFVTKET